MASKLPDKNDNAALARFSMERWQKLDSFYDFWTRRWRFQLDFIRAEHWRTLQTLAPEAIPEWEEWPVVNFVRPLYADYMRQWLQAKVRYEAVPDLPTQRAIASAELADQVLSYFWDKLVSPIKADLAAWLMATGNADLRVFWNTDTGDMIPLAIPDAQSGQLIPINPQTMQPDPAFNNGQPLMVDAGEIGVESISPQLVRWPFEKSHGCMIGFLLAYDDVYGHYGEDVAKKLTYQKMPRSLSNDLLSIQMPGMRMATDERALIIEHYLPKSSRFPDGLWWTASGTQMIVPANTLPARYMPIVPFRWIPMPGHPTLGMSPLEDARFVNKIYEKSMKRTMEWQKKIVPKTVLTSGGGVKKDDLTEEPGQALTVNQGGAPTYTQMPQPPETFERIRNEMQQVLSVVGLYKSEKREETAPGEQSSPFRKPKASTNDGQEVSLCLLNSVDSWEKLGYIMLDYMVKFYTDTRTVAIVGPDRGYQWRQFSGTDLENLQATIHIDTKSLFTWNKQSMQDAVIGLMNTKAGQVMLMGDDGQLDRDRVDAALEAAGLSQDFSMIDPDILEARNVLNDIQSMGQQDQPPQMKQWQNHQAHLAEYYKMLKSIEYRGWQPWQQQALEQLTSQHEQALQGQQQQQQQTMMDQEQQLRTIRATTESAKNTRSALGEALVKALVDALMGNLPDDTKKEVPKSTD